MYFPPSHILSCVPPFQFHIKELLYIFLNHNSLSRINFSSPYNLSRTVEIIFLSTPSESWSHEPPPLIHGQSFPHLVSHRNLTRCLFSMKRHPICNLISLICHFLFFHPFWYFDVITYTFPTIIMYFPSSYFRTWYVIRYVLILPSW